MAYEVINGKLVKVGRNKALTKPLNCPMGGLSHLRTLEVGGKYYGLFHNSDDDARYLHDEDGNLVLVIDSSLNVTTGEGRFGNIESDNTWTLYYGSIRTRFDTGIPVQNHHWKALEDAEVKVCEFYVESILLPKFKRADDTEGGSCD